MTSPIEQIRVRCPRCGHEYETFYRGSVNADLDPEIAADAEYLRDVSTGTCPSCDHVVDLGTLVVDGDVWTLGGGQ